MATRTQAARNRTAVLAAIEAGDVYHFQGDWRTCIAGITVDLLGAGYEDYVTEFGMATAITRLKEDASDLLGLNEDDAEYLFESITDEGEAIEFLRNQGGR